MLPKTQKVSVKFSMMLCVLSEIEVMEPNVDCVTVGGSIPEQVGGISEWVVQLCVSNERVTTV